MPQPNEGNWYGNSRSKHYQLMEINTWQLGFSSWLGDLAWSCFHFHHCCQLLLSPTLSKGLAVSCLYCSHWNRDQNPLMITVCSGAAVMLYLCFHRLCDFLNIFSIHSLAFSPTLCSPENDVKYCCGLKSRN